ncbi:hypothetical protein MMC06_004792, partial [Schaereria dolodes]|nr:hypothetical protein [Schaereria dolodes]
YPGVIGIHILIGVKNASTGKFNVIYVDHPALPVGSLGVYQPQEQISWWYQENNMTGQVYRSTSGALGGVDMSVPAPNTGKYEWWTTYTINDGQWTNSQYAPSAKLTAPPRSEYLDEVEIYPVLRFAFFTIVVGAAMRQDVRSYVYNYLSASFTGVAVEFTASDGKVLRISYGAPRGAKKGTRAIIGADAGVAGNPDEPIQAALESALEKHLLPDNEKWTFDRSPGDTESAEEHPTIKGFAYEDSSIKDWNGERHSAKE